MKKALRLVGINFLVLLALVSGLNLAAVTVSYVYDTWFFSTDFWDELPGYDGPDRTEEIERDFWSLETTYQPFTTWRRLPYSGPTTTVDERGMRTHRVNRANRSDARRVAFFGGSTMWGSGVRDDATIPAHFERMRDDLVAHNFGETGYNSRQSLERLINALNAGETFDVVVFYDGVNEAPGCRPGVSLNTNDQELEIRSRLRAQRGWRTFLSLVRPTTTFLGKAARATSPAPKGVCSDDPERARAVANVLLGNWRHARAIAAAHGIEFYAVLQPVSFTGTSPIDHLTLDQSLGDQYRAFYPIVRREIAVADADWIVDLTDVFDGSSYVYTDFCHLSSDGNATIAGRLAELIA